MFKPFRLLALAPWLLVVALGGTLVAKLRPQPFTTIASTPISATLEAISKQNHLNVFTARIATIVDSNHATAYGLLTSHQTAVIPATVTYTLDMARLPSQNLQWDEAAQTLRIQLPALDIGKPDVDEPKARYFRDGLWISGKAQDALMKAASLVAEKEALKQAAAPDLIKLARSAAKDAIRANLSLVLTSTGHPKAQVVVTITGE